MVVLGAGTWTKGAMPGGAHPSPPTHPTFLYSPSGFGYNPVDRGCPRPAFQIVSRALVPQPVLHVVVAAYNEANNVPRLLADLHGLRAAVREEFTARVVLVDDGSSDDTARLARSLANGLPFEVLQHLENRGPGRAFATAFAHLAGSVCDDDWVVTMEGDNTSRVETLLHMLARRKEGYDVVLASAYSYGGGFIGTAWWRLALSHAANELTLAVLRLYGLRTLSSFFRIHAGQALRRIQAVFGPQIVESDGFEWAVEMLYKMALLRMRLSEVETQVDWRRRVGASKMRTLRTIRGYFRVFLRHGRWRRQAERHEARTP